MAKKKSQTELLKTVSQAAGLEASWTLESAQEVAAALEIKVRYIAPTSISGAGLQLGKGKQYATDDPVKDIFEYLAARLPEPEKKEEPAEDA